MILSPLFRCLALHECYPADESSLKLLYLSPVAGYSGFQYFAVTNSEAIKIVLSFYKDVKI